MRELKFRQAMFRPITGKFARWHYWGLIDGVFVGINTGWYTPTEAVENSCRYTGRKDRLNVEIYEGDKLTYPGHKGYYEIRWDDADDECGFVCERIEPSPNYMLPCVWKDMEIIGNIKEEESHADNSNI